MTVSAQTPINRSTGNGVTTVFPYTFKIIADADIEVTVDDVVKTLNVDYTVSGAGVDAGGNVTMTVAPANATSVVRRRNMALVRSTDYQDQGELPATTLDNDIDATVLMVQQLDERLDRTFSLPASFSGDSTLPAPEPGYLIGWDATGENLTNIPASVGDSLVDLAAPSGSSLIGYQPTGTGSVPTTVQTKLRERVSVFDFMTSAQIADVIANTATLDVTAACQAAVTAVIAAGGGTVYFPAGTYLLNGAAGSDTYENGILVPFGAVNVYPLTSPVRLVGVYGGSVLKAGNNGMILVRNSRNHTIIENLAFDGNSKTDVIGIGHVPESMTQTVTLVSNGYSKVQNVTINDTAIGIVYQPGPTVTGSDSGCFYHEVDNFLGNQNNLHMWFKADITAGTNRTTRTVVSNSVMARGNSGVLIDKGTEIDFIATNFEHFAAAFAGGSVLPHATPTAFDYTDTNPANVRLIGGYMENCDVNVTAVNTTAAKQIQFLGFYHNGAVSALEANMLKLSSSEINFPAITRTFKGTVADVVIDAGGNGITFTGTGTNSIGNGTGAAQVNKCDHQYFRSVAGVDVVRLDTVGTLSLFPTTDNATLLGQSGFRWSAVWAANGTIQTSDPRTKKDVIDSPLGLEFINALHPVAYKFKIGGNKIVGVREVKPAEYNDAGELTADAITENIVEPQPGKRQHFGFLTTEVKAAIGDVDFGGYVKTNPDDPESEEALRYDEFIAPLVRAVQELTQRLKVVESALLPTSHPLTPTEK